MDDFPQIEKAVSFFLSRKLLLDKAGLRSLTKVMRGMPSNLSVFFARKITCVWRQKVPQIIIDCLRFLQVSEGILNAPPGNIKEASTTCGLEQLLDPVDLSIYGLRQINLTS